MQETIRQPLQNGLQLVLTSTAITSNCSKVRFLIFWYSRFDAVFLGLGVVRSCDFRCRDGPQSVLTRQQTAPQLKINYSLYTLFCLLFCLVCMVYQDVLTAVVKLYRALATLDHYHPHCTCHLPDRTVMRKKWERERGSPSFYWCVTFSVATYAHGRVESTGAMSSCFMPVS